MSRNKNKIQEDLPHLRDDLAPSRPKSRRFNVHTTTSDLKGIAGVVESLLRSFKSVAFALAMLPIAITYAVSIGLALTPGFYLVKFCFEFSQGFGGIGHGFITCLSLAAAYLIYGISLIFIVPFFNKIMFLKLKPWRGGWYSLQSLPWYYHNALVQLVRYTFLDLATPSPLNVLFYKMMGMKVGKGVMINTTNISDPCLITLEDNVTIGGSATIFAHYAQGGFLVVEPVIIRKGATVGLKASIMGDVIVGEKVTVKPHSILLPKTRLMKGDKQ
ncbi:hypothetical protein A9Q84_02070 [Halobacteriovorax marinus]|uniref:Uncharacterized protein n=1 Tax=Halobacteriovorax marinus TaxID=97084 RepID=A0A1Y5FJ05_9BACT|nr:hypothetical protein A9Q84_02070 [Halobacteriovorax marinus]